VRVLAYREEDIELVCDKIKELFTGVNGDSVTVDNMDKGGVVNFYKAKHSNVSLHEDALVGVYENLRGTTCEIQVCSMMAHVWNEIEHDIGYKPTGDPGADESSLLTALGHLTRSGDKVISQLLIANQTRLANETHAFTSQFDFAARLRGDFGNVDMSRNVNQVFEYLMSRDVTSPSALREYLGVSAIQLPDIGQLQDFNDFLETEYSTNYRLDPNSADVLLMLLLQKEAKEITAAHPSVGRGRPMRIKKLAEAFVEYVQRRG
jgi:hypothetical protein